jgi:quercetin 2,3-dioxygenase
MNEYKKINSISFANEFQMGPMKVKQPLPAKGITQVDPFLLLHHAGPQEILPGSSQERISPHPHRGFEPVTFLYQGQAFHRDSMGNEGILNPGDVQWMTAGKGIVHSEGLSEEFMKRGGTMEMIQLWINLPKKYKMTEPTYQDIPLEKMPLISDENYSMKLRLVAGSYVNENGPAKTKIPLLAMNGEIEAGASGEIEIPSGFNSMIYILSGEVEINDETPVNKFNLVIFGKEKTKIKIAGKVKSVFLLLAGEPIGEPVATYGPFVMNDNRELQQAILDYQEGRMGTLDY